MNASSKSQHFLRGNIHERGFDNPHLVAARHPATVNIIRLVTDTLILFSVYCERVVEASHPMII